ncbi:MAG: ABC transporter permease [Alphaproteobacteria bacterium]
MRPLHGAWAVFVKETVDNFRDRRSVFMALIYPFIGALLLGLLLNFVGGMLRGQGESKLVISVQGAEHAPDLIAFLNRAGIEVRPAPPSPRAAVRAGHVDAVLQIPPDFTEKVEALDQAQVKMIINATRLSTVVSVSRVSQQVREYAVQLAVQRLRALDLPDTLASAVRIDNVNVGRSRSLAGFFLNMLPPFIIFTIFVGGVYLAIDSTAGERERGSLEPLLANPVPRWQIMLGKAGATMAFTTVAVLLQLGAFKLMFEYVSRGDYGIRINPGYDAFVAAFLVTVPLMAFATSIQMIITTVSRSYKETQTYLGLLPLIPSLPGMILVFVPVSTKLWMLLIPTFGQILVIGKLMRQEPVLWSEALIASASTGLLAVLLLAIAARLYDRDQVLFGG